MESTNQDNLLKTKYIKVDSRHLGIGSALGDSPDVTIANPTLEEIYSTDQKESIAKLNQFLQENEIVPDERQKEIIALARDYVINKCNEIGLDVPTEDIPIILISQQKMDEFYHQEMMHDNNLDKKVTGVSPTLLNSVMIVSESDPEYFFGKKIAHELIHKIVDRNVRAYTVQTRIDGTHYMTSEAKRTGLVVSKPSYFENDHPIELLRNKIKVVDTHGEIINELPNYFYEHVFIEDLLLSERGKELYKAEIEQREKLLNNDPHINEYGIAFVRNDGQKIILFRNNIHYDSNGDIILNDEILMHQLSDLLDSMIGDIGDETVFAKMLRAKADPRKQQPVAKSIDHIMGKGFYYHLKETQMNFENLEKLLVEVQQKFESQPTS